MGGFFVFGVGQWAMGNGQWAIGNGKGGRQRTGNAEGVEVTQRAPRREEDVGRFGGVRKGDRVVSPIGIVSLKLLGNWWIVVGSGVGWGASVGCVGRGMCLARSAGRG